MALDIEGLTNLEDQEAGYQWIKKKGLFIQNRRCESCQEPLELRLREVPLNERQISDFWICTKDQCAEGFREVRVLMGSFFQYGYSQSLKLPYQIYLIKYFCEKRESEEVETLLNLSPYRVNNYFKECHEFIVRYLAKFPIVLGGNNIVVAAKLYPFPSLDLFMKNWLLVMVDTSKSPLIGYLDIIISDDFSKVLQEALRIIEIIVDHHSIIASDIWGNPPQVSSNKFRIQNCSDFHMNDLCNYYDSCIEAIREIKKLNAESVKLTLIEFMWRERYQNDAFNTFINQLNIFYNQN